MIASRKFLKEKAAEMKESPTVAEAVLWEQLRAKKLGFVFWRQYSKKGFIIDFYCNGIKLGIECDGKHHREPENAFRDAWRSKKLAGAGILIIRFNNWEVVHATGAVIDKIKKECRDRKNYRRRAFNERMRWSLAKKV